MLGFIVAIVVGFFVPQLEGPAARPLAAFMGKYMTLEAAETRLLAFIVGLLIAGVVSSLLDSGAAFWIVIGVTLGYFGTRIVDAGRAAMEARKQD